MSENKETNSSRNYFSNLGKMIKRESLTITNRFMDKISVALEISKTFKDKEEQSDKIPKEKKIILKERDDAEIQNILTIQEDEDHKIYKYCLDYDEEDEDLEDEELSEEEKKKFPNGEKNKSPIIINKNNINDSIKIPKENSNTSQKFFAENISNPEEIRNNNICSNSSNNIKIPEIPYSKFDTTISPNVRFNIDNKSENTYNNTFKPNPRKFNFNNINREEETNNDDTIEYVSTCHRIFQKGTQIDVEGLIFFNCFQIKKKNKFLSLIGIGENNWKKEKYGILIDEYFIYFLKDKLLEKSSKNSNDIKKIEISPNTRRVGNHFDIRKITNLDAKELNENIIKIIIVFNLSNDSINDYKSKIKEIEFDKEEAEKFILLLKSQLKKYNIPLLS